MVYIPISMRTREYFIMFVLTAVLSAFFVFAIILIGDRPTSIIILPLLAIFLVCISNYQFSIVILVVSLFVDFYYIIDPTLVYSTSVIFSVILGISLFLTFHYIDWKEFSNPLTIPILVYGACILPSLINAVSPWTSLFSLLNVAAFLIVLYSMVARIRTYIILKRIVLVFLLMVFINSLDVFRLSMLGIKRPFGFAGIWFVDYSALGICLSITISLISRGFSRAFFIILSVILTISLILTQTRNTWFSAIFTLAVLLVYLILHPEFIGFTRKRFLLFTSIGLSFLIGAVLVALILNPKTITRASELTEKSGYSINEGGFTDNSLVTRLFIWDTALNAFQSHPLVGIGVYSFPSSSQDYYRIPRLFYDRYVKGSRPHQTYLAVLTETGIVGFLGFLFLMGTILKQAFRTINIASDPWSKRYALVAAISVVYCSVSMFFTDAWLWGHQIILLGIVFGSVLAINKIMQCSIDSTIQKIE